VTEIDVFDRTYTFSSHTLQEIRDPTHAVKVKAILLRRALMLSICCEVLSLSKIISPKQVDTSYDVYYEVWKGAERMQTVI
jgi:uncharacterized membrane protein